MSEGHTAGRARPMSEAPRDGTQVWLFAEHVKPSVWEYDRGAWRRGNGLHWREDDAYGPQGWLPVEPPQVSP